MAQQQQPIAGPQEGEAPVWQMHPDPNPHKDFKTNYEMKDELGKGGFGTVKRCIFKAPGGGIRRELAAKFNNTPNQKKSMLEEARICRALSEINASGFIVNIFDSIEEGDIIYNMYEMADGGDLNDEIASKEFFTEQEAAIAICHILRGVNHMHERGFIHRDLKPANILLKSKRVKIYKVADFGLSCQLLLGPPDAQNQRHGLNKGAVGTAAYRPPETHVPDGTLDKAKKEEYGKDFDIWSCGVILYEMLAGYQPFSPPDMEKSIYKCKLEFPSPEWDGLEEAKNMIKLMIAPTVKNKDVTKRPELRAEYPELAGMALYRRGERIPVPLDIPENVLEIFNQRRVLKQQLLQQYANQLAAQQGVGAAPQGPQGP